MKPFYVRLVLLLAAVVVCFFIDYRWKIRRLEKESGQLQALLRSQKAA